MPHQDNQQNKQNKQGDEDRLDNFTFLPFLPLTEQEQRDRFTGGRTTLAGGLSKEEQKERDRLFGGLQHRFFGEDAPIFKQGSSELSLLDASGAASTLGSQLAGVLGAAPTDLALERMDQILQRKGSLAPEAEARLRQEVAGVGGATELANRGQAARTGAGGSLAGAVSQALGRSTQGIESDLDTALAKDKAVRRRKDTGLLSDFFIQPSVQLQGAADQLKSFQSQKQASAAAKKQGKVQTIGTILGMVLAGVCWVARRCLGPDNPDWILAREWLLENADNHELALYANHGEATANRLTDEEVAELRPLFEDMVEEQKNG